MTIKPILKPPHIAALLILSDRQGDDIAYSAPIQVPGMGVVDRMVAPPHVIGRQRQNPKHTAQPVIGKAAFEKRLMAAIVLDQEQPHQRHPVQQRNAEGKRIADRQRHPGKRP